MIKHIPGGWITVLVGGAVFIYLVGNSNVNPTATTFSNDTVGVGVKNFPGGLFGTLVALASVGAFLNKETIGTVAPAV
jgi:hypothetical protein